MKKLFIVGISLVVLIAIMFLPGCGGGNSGDPGGGVKELKVYQTAGSGGVAQLSQNNEYGLVFAAGLLEIGEDYVLYIDGATPYIEAYVKNGTNPDGTPIVVNTKVELTKDFTAAGYNDCFNFNSLTYQANGKTTTEVVPSVPGKCKLISTGDGIVKTIEVLVFDGAPVLPGATSGWKVDNSGHTLSALKAECAIYINAFSDPTLPGKSILVDTADQINWRGKMKNITTVDVAAVGAGAADRTLNPGDICVAEAPGGGYIKVTFIQGCGLVWEYTAGTSFR